VVWIQPVGLGEQVAGGGAVKVKLLDSPDSPPCPRIGGTRIQSRLEGSAGSVEIGPPEAHLARQAPERVVGPEFEAGSNQTVGLRHLAGAQQRTAPRNNPIIAMRNWVRFVGRFHPRDHGHRESDPEADEMATSLHGLLHYRQVTV